MAYFTNMSSSLNDSMSFVVAAASEYPAASYALISNQSPVALGFTTFLAAVVSFLGYQAWRPAVHPLSPKFTKDSIPILGSWGFMARQWHVLRDRASCRLRLTMLAQVILERGDQRI